VKKISAVVIILMVLLVFVVGCTSNSRINNQRQEDEKITEHSAYDVADFPIEELSEEELNALNLTLNDEFKAEAIYQKVIDRFGEVKPFSNIIGAEQKHSAALIEIYQKYDLPIPINDWYDKVPEFDSVADACSAGVDAEIENAALYDDLFSVVDNQDVIAVFTSLRDASINNHLPAFQRCANK
jgi:hypothetical protein